MDRVSRTVRSCGPCGRRSGWNWPWSRTPRDRSPRGACRTRTPGGRAETVDGVGHPARQLEEGAGVYPAQQGVPGIDDMTVDELGSHLKEHWPEIRSRLLDGACTVLPGRCDGWRYRRHRAGFARAAYRQSERTVRQACPEGRDRLVQKCVAPVPVDARFLRCADCGSPDVKQHIGIAGTAPCQRPRYGQCLLQFTRPDQA